MKFLIYLCCIAHLLTLISARLRLTTPLPSALHLNDDATSQTLNFAEIIDFVNNVNNNDGRRIARRGRYDPTFRRFASPAVKGMNLLPSVELPKEKDAQNQLENLADTVRYQVIDNPEVLEEYSNKQKEKNNDNLLKPAVDSNNTYVGFDSSAEAKSFSTSDKKLRYYQSKYNATASYTTTNHNIMDEFVYTPHPDTVDGFQELTTIESIYRPSFPDDDNDDTQESVTEKGISTPRTDEKNNDELKINNTVEIEKRTMDNTASGKVDQAGLEEEKAPKDDTKDTGQMKHELPSKTDNNNNDDEVIVEVTVNEEKSGNNKEYTSSKLDYNTNEKPSEDNVHPRDENYGNKNINVFTDTNSKKDNIRKGRSLETNNVIGVPVERFIGRNFKSALRNKQENNNYDYMVHSIYALKEKNENSNKEFENRQEKRDEYDRKKKDKKKYNWNKIDNKPYKKDKKFDRMEYEWNNRHLQYDENDNNWNKNGKKWDKNDDFGSRDHDSNKRDNDWDNRHDDWKKRVNDWKKRNFDSNKRDNDWNNRDIDLNKRDNDWNNRDIDSNKRDNDWNNRDIDSNKRDNDWNKRDNDWNNRDIDLNNRDIEWNKQDSKIYKDDRNKNDEDLKKEWENKYLQHTTVENGGDIGHERYEIIERSIKDGDKRHYVI